MFQVGSPAWQACWGKNDTEASKVSMDTDPAIIDTASQIQIIDHLSAKLRACYIFPDVADQICIRLQRYLQCGEYKDLTDGNLFALALTLHLQEVSHDEHLWVRWHAETLPEDESQLRLHPTWQAQQQLEATLANFGFYKLERLPSNVGYLDIRYFHRPEWGGDTVVSAMNFLSHTHALIIDLRQCTGGYPGMVALVCSYLFREESIHLASIYWRDEDRTQEFWTHAPLESQPYVTKPMYVLISKITFSAGEMLADILKSRKRATIIGEQTDGGAHPGASYRIHSHFEAFIPIGRTTNPLTGINWEGCGITPDICIPKEAAFNVAYKLALQSILAEMHPPLSAPLLDLVAEANAVLKDLEAEG
jgi:Peptidase family S41/N-terminal domain of Peptidase_S41 in eukaryotic IRBP